MSCVTCSVFEAYVSNSSDYLDLMVSNIQSGVVSVVIAVGGAWIAVSGYKVVMGSKNVILFIQEFAAFVICVGILSTIDSLTGTVFQTCISVMGGLSSAITGFGGNGTSALGSVLQAAEESIIKVFVIVGTFIGDAGWSFSIFTRTLYGIALILPYGLLLILFLSHTAISLFRITMIVGLSPIIVAFTSFPFGRDVFGAGIRTLVSAILTMLSVTLVFSIVVKSLDALQIGADSSVSPDEFGNLTSGPYLVALFMGWLGTALLHEAVAIAGSVGSAALGSIGAGVISGGSTRAMNSAGRGAYGAAKSGYEKYKNRKKAGEISTPTE